jgi:arylsulfatase A-like enzyme
MKKVNLIAAIAAIAAGLLAPGFAKGSPATAPPNFIFMITDDVSPDDLGPYGNPVVKTPNLDLMAKRGLVFDQAYLTISSCSPSRCSIITGRYPHNHGAPELHTTLPAGQKTFVQSLRQAGYHTVLSGKNHMTKPKDLGFDISSDSGPSGSEKWLDHLRDRPQDKPFFCWFASHDAHHGWQVNDKAPTYDPAKIPVPPMLADGPETRKELANHAHEVSRTDHYLGVLYAELERQGVADNTFVIYCADNGRPFPRCKTYLYDSGIKAPLLVTGPGVAPGRTGSMVSSIDFSATILDLAGVAKPETIQGVSFAPVLKDPSAKTRDVAFSERNWHVYQNHARSVRHGDFLYIWTPWPHLPGVSAESAMFRFPAAKELWDDAAAGKLSEAQALLTKTPQPAEMLFHTGRDPHQFNNLSANPEFSDTLTQMRGLLDRWKEQTGDSVPDHPTPDRQPLHQGADRKDFKRGEFPGAAKNATGINHPGPVLIDHFTSSGTPSSDPSALPEDLKLPGLVIKRKEQCIDIDATVCLREGALELIACTKGTKEHESIIVVDAKPVHIHAALLLLRAKPGNPAMRKPLDDKGERWEDIPPQGCPVKVFLVIKDKEGKSIERPISDFITRSDDPYNSTPGNGERDGKDDAKFPTHTFLFAGSMLIGEGSGPRRYLCDQSGNVISIATFGDEMLCLPEVHSADNGALMWRADPTHLPALQTKIILRLRPPTVPAIDGGAPTPNATPHE